MKKLLVSVLAIGVLNGCTVIDAFLMTKYDPSEYRIITEIRTDANQAKSECSNPLTSSVNAVSLASKTALFQNYSENIPRNENGFRAAKALNEIAQGLSQRYQGKDPVSPIFCKLKFESVENSATLIQHTLGNRPR
jgi:hypothetical protein